MARTVVNPTQVTRAGVAPSTPVACDVVNGNVVNNWSVHHFIEVTNEHATVAKTITFVTPGTAGGYAITDAVVSIPAAVTRRFADFPNSLFGSNLEFNGETTDVKYAVYQLIV